ncbi:hypothetical protein, partial [Paraburkholderia hospita]|uniref:hypothetical protein n=1 Tax=Paraburkholderia hospita TaxID=169430 RepID=UPI001A99E50D
RCRPAQGRRLNSKHHIADASAKANKPNSVRSKTPPREDIKSQTARAAQAPSPGVADKKPEKQKNQNPLNTSFPIARPSSSI